MAKQLVRNQTVYNGVTVTGEPPLKRKILISRCLLGEAVRYDGAHNDLGDVTLQTWLAEGRLVPVCPEVAGGLPVPRPACEIVGEGGGAAVLSSRATVDSIDGEDRTAEFVAGAQVALDLANRHDVICAILKESSPSCGSTKIYDGSHRGTKKPGKGVTAALLEQHGFRVFSEQTLQEAFTFIQANDSAAK